MSDSGKLVRTALVVVAVAAVILLMMALTLLFLFPAPSHIDCDLDHANHSEHLYLEIETDKKVYDRGEEVVFSIFFVNEMDTDFSHTHSGGRSWELVAYDSEGREVVNSSAGWIDHTGINTFEVPANSQKIIDSNFSWDQTPDPWSSHDEPVPRDCYTLRFYLKHTLEVFGELRILIR